MFGLKITVATLSLLLTTATMARTPETATPVENTTSEVVTPQPAIEPATNVTVLPIEPTTPVEVEETAVTPEAVVDPVQVLMDKARTNNSARSRMRTAELTETECLATALYHEARGESERGQKAVAFVIYNRVKSGRFPDNFCKVILQKSQFSFTSDRNPDNIKDWEVFKKLLAMAVFLLDNGGFREVKSPVGDALFFNSFRSGAVWRNVKWVTTIGKHHFFK